MCTNKGKGTKVILYPIEISFIFGPCATLRRHLLGLADHKGLTPDQSANNYIHLPPLVLVHCIHFNISEPDLGSGLFGQQLLHMEHLGPVRCNNTNLLTGHPVLLFISFHLA